MNIVKPVDQICNGCLSGSCTADKGHFLSRRSIQLDIVQHNFIRCIAKVYIVKHHVTRQAGISHRTIAVRMFPCPTASALFAFYKGTVGLFLDIHQGNIALVRFRFFIQQRKDALRACKRHDNAVELLADLRDRLRKALIERQEGYQGPQRQSNIPIDCQGRPDDCTEHITQIANLHIGGHQDIGKCICLLGAFPQVFI